MNWNDEGKTHSQKNCERTLGKRLLLELLAKLATTSPPHPRYWSSPSAPIYSLIIKSVSQEEGDRGLVWGIEFLSYHTTTTTTHRAG